MSKWKSFGLHVIYFCCAYAAGRIFMNYGTRVNDASQHGITDGHGRAINQSWSDFDLVVMPLLLYCVIQAVIVCVSLFTKPRNYWMLTLIIITSSCTCGVALLRLMFAFD